MSKQDGFNGDPATFAIHATKLNKNEHPDIQGVREVMLSDGPRSRRMAKYWTLVNRHTGEVHH